PRPCRVPAQLLEGMAGRLPQSAPRIGEVRQRLHILDESRLQVLLLLLLQVTGSDCRLWSNNGLRFGFGTRPSSTAAPGNRQQPRAARNQGAAPSADASVVAAQVSASAAASLAA